MQKSSFKQSLVPLAILCLIATQAFGAEPKYAARVSLSHDEDLAATVGERIIQQPVVHIVANGHSVFSRPGATFIVVHLSSVHLGSSDRVILVDASGAGHEFTVNVDEDGEASLPPIAGDRVDLKLHCATADCFVNVDRFSRGLSKEEREEKSTLSEFVQTCGDLDLENAICREGTEVYEHSKPVARLMRDGDYACTGWLLGTEGHLLTNYHCINGTKQAAAMTFEFLAEGDECSTDCSEWGACPGRLTVTGATLIYASSSLDYALVQLPKFCATHLGHLTVRTTVTDTKERVYIPQHPAAQGKQIAFRSTVPEDAKDPNAGFCKLTGYKVDSCRPASPIADYAYFADTDTGSSGAPVIAFSDNKVIAMHQCAGCPNTGIPINLIVDDMTQRHILPPGSVSP
jgi:lysyl endopeptidase